MKTFKKYTHIPAPPEEVYLALTKAQSIQLWTGAEAEFMEEAGTEFSLLEGDIVGKNIEFETNKKIVQQWYFGEDNEPGDRLRAWLRSDPCPAPAVYRLSIC